jgi:transposase
VSSSRIHPSGDDILLLANGGAHPAQRFQWPENVRYVWLPPYGPELNPIERVRRDLTDDLAWRHFPTLEAQQLSGGDLLQAYDASALQGLTGDTS